MIYLRNMLSGKEERVTGVSGVSPMLRAAGFGVLSKQQTDALLSLIHDDQVKKNYGMLQGAELMRDILSRTHSLPRAFDDLAMIRPPARLGETNRTVAELEEVEYRIRNSQKRAMQRTFVNCQMELDGAVLPQDRTPPHDKELALYGFARLAMLIHKTHGNECLYVCLGRSPTAIAAWLQTKTPRVCLLPFSGARLDDLSNASVERAREHTRSHFDRMLAPHLRGIGKIVLIDYSTSAESILTMYNMVMDYLKLKKNGAELNCVSLWHSKNAEEAASPGMQGFLDAARTRLHDKGETLIQLVARYFRGDKFISHMHLRELVDEQFGVPFSFVTRWPAEMRRNMFTTMMHMLDNQSLDFLSPYKKASVLEGAKAVTFMGEEGLRRFKQLQDEMIRVERDHRQLELAIHAMQPKPL